MRELSDTHRRAAVSLCKSVVVASDDGPPSAEAMDALLGALSRLLCSCEVTSNAE